MYTYKNNYINDYTRVQVFNLKKNFKKENCDLFLKTNFHIEIYFFNEFQNRFSWKLEHM